MLKNDRSEQKLEECWNQLKKASPEHVRAAFGAYCVKNVELVDAGKISQKEAAYNMCGACSSLSQDVAAEFDDLMNLVCDLELPEDIRPSSAAEWEQVVRIIKDKWI